MCEEIIQEIEIYFNSVFEKAKDGDRLGPVLCT